MLTGISRLKCDICNSGFIGTATGSSHPYDDYTCIKCGWKGTICESCAKNNCIQCDGTLKSTHKTMSDAYGGNIIF